MSRPDDHKREHYINVNRIVLQRHVKTSKVLERMKRDKIFPGAWDEILQEIEAEKTNVGRMRRLLDNLTYLGPKAHRSFWRAVAIDYSDFMKNSLVEEVPREIYMDHYERYPLTGETFTPDLSTDQASRFPATASDNHPPAREEVIAGGRTLFPGLWPGGFGTKETAAQQDTNDSSTFGAQWGTSVIAQETNYQPSGEMNLRERPVRQGSHPEDTLKKPRTDSKDAAEYDTKEIVLILVAAALLLGIMIVISLSISSSTK